MASTHFSGLNIGSGGDLSAILVGSVSVNPASLADAATADTSVTITGVATGDIVIMCPPTAGLTAGMSIVGSWVSAANTVKIRLRNASGGTVDEAAASWNYVVFKK